jgi:hypothetical protein
MLTNTSERVRFNNLIEANPKSEHFGNAICIEGVALNGELALKMDQIKARAAAFGARFKAGMSASN